MIRNARVLKEDFVPKEVEHRETEVNRLSNALEPITRGEQGDDSFLFGPTGVGKTCISRYTLERLQEEVLEVEYQYVNCWQDYNRFRVLYRVLDGLGKTVDIHRKSTPKDELVERLREHSSPYVIVLDEVDQLRDYDVLYDFYLQDNITTIMIANREEELFASMDERIVSRFKSSKRIDFDKYRVNELVSILKDRVKWGLEPGAIEDYQLEQIADAAAGDARVAIGALRTAARDADADGLEEITDEIIENAVPEARDEIQQKNVDKLNRHQRKLYEIIENEGEISPGELYEKYENEVEDPVTERSLRNYLNKMDHYDIIESIGSNRGRRYRVQESEEFGD